MNLATEKSYTLAFAKANGILQFLTETVMDGSTINSGITLSC